MKSITLYLYSQHLTWIFNVSFCLVTYITYQIISPDLNIFFSANARGRYPRSFCINVHLVVWLYSIVICAFLRTYSPLTYSCSFFLSFTLPILISYYYYVCQQGFCAQHPTNQNHYMCSYLFLSTHRWSLHLRKWKLLLHFIPFVASVNSPSTECDSFSK